MKGLVSVIVSTYNKPDYLALTLRSLRAQTDRDFEVIVADDGSDERTKCVVKCEEKFIDLTTKHVWHPKQGFRLAAIRNRAVEAASGQYLIFMDGDCLAPPDFVATHRRLAEAGWHVIGQRVLLSRSFTHRILQKFSDDQDEIPFIKWNLAYFALHYCGRSVNRLLPFVKLPLCSYRTHAPRSWDRVRGCNWAMWTADYKSVFGSDEAFEGWGAEDTDLAVRLYNRGIRAKLGTCASYVLHLWHEANHNSVNGERKEALIQERIQSGTFMPERGLSTLKGDFLCAR